MAERTRVSTLAKELGITSKDLIAALEDMGEIVKSASSMVAEAVVERVREAFAAGTGEPESAEVEGPSGEAADESVEPPVVGFSAPFVQQAAAPAPALVEKPAVAAPHVLFQAPPEVAPAPRRRSRAAAEAEASESAELESEELPEASVEGDEGAEAEGETPAKRRRRRGRRGRGGQAGGADTGEDAESGEGESAEDADEDLDEEDHADHVAEAALSASARRRRRRRRAGSSDVGTSDEDPANTVVHVRESRAAAEDDGVRGVKGSTRLEAKRQRRRDNRDSGRRRAPILSEAEFLARRESVDRVMAVRQTADRTQIAVLEDDILVEHYVTRASAASAVGNVYLGRVQNVLPSMEAAFIDIGRGRNGVLYAGEVNWDAVGLEGKARSIESAMASGDTVLVQVTKDPIGHKGARLTSQISLPGRFVVYVPGGGMTGISRKLPDTERSRLKSILKKVVPEDAGVIVRTAAEGASEEDLISDVERLKAQWEGIQAKAAKPSNAPTLVYGEPDLAIRVVRDVFNDDFRKLVVSGKDIHETLMEYVNDVAPDLAPKISRHTGEGDLFHDLRVDEQLAKALDRKVWLPSGGSLVIDRTEAMTVIDVNTGKYTGSGGTLEQTVTRNNLEAAEEIVRQLRLRDIGGIVVIDFIDMVLESNRDLVLRRLIECLGRDRTKHQVAEVTSLGLVQMTRKRVGEGLLEAFSEPCDHCKGRGVIVHSEPVEKKSSAASDSDEERPAKGGRNRNRGKQKAAPAEAPVDEAELERRKAAANAIAKIAAASHHHEDDELISAPLIDIEDTEHEGEFDSAIKTLDEAAFAHAEEIATDASAADDDESESYAFADAVVGGAVGTDGSDGVGPVEDQVEVQVEVPVAEVQVADVEQAAVTVSAPAASSRPRRRRGASRPAGPPMATVAGDASGETGTE